jgi:glycine cleavage system aminomethyltransferase T
VALDNGLGLDVQIDDVTDAVAALALQGPASREILQQVVDGDIAGPGRANAVLLPGEEAR